MIIGIDFDGTMVDHMFPQIGEPVPHAVNSVRAFQSVGAKIILWTMRSDSEEAGSVLTEAVDYMNSNGIILYGINQNPDQHWSKSPKAYCNIYIDDAAFGCPLIKYPGFERPCVNWAIVGSQVLRML